MAWRKSQHLPLPHSDGSLVAIEKQMRRRSTRILSGRRRSNGTKSRHWWRPYCQLIILFQVSSSSLWTSAQSHFPVGPSTGSSGISGSVLSLLTWMINFWRDSPTKVEDVNFCMDIFGYTFFMSLAFAFIPQMIISFYAYTNRNAQLGEFVHWFWRWWERFLLAETNTPTS